VSQQWEEGIALASISYAIPLATALKDNLVGKGQFDFLEKGEGETANCPGTAYEPKAAPGRGCIYTLEATGEAELALAYPSTTAGAFLYLTTSATGGQAVGTWAVTAPCSNQGALEDELATLKAQLGDAEGELSNLESEVTEYENPANGHTQQEIDDKKAERDAKKAQVQSLETAISAKEAEVDAAKSC
jgi:hypothetical protein